MEGNPRRQTGVLVVVDPHEDGLKGKRPFSPRYRVHPVPRIDPGPNGKLRMLVCDVKNT